MVNKVGPYRVWHPTIDCPGLAMSRSIGDYVAHQYGVIPDPEVIEYKITPLDKFIILATDGVWEFLSNQEVVNIISNELIKTDLQTAARVLVEKSREKWCINDKAIDDIT